MHNHIKKLIIPVLTLAILLNIKILHQTIPQRTPVYFTISDSLQEDIQEQQSNTPHFILTMFRDANKANN